MPTRAPLGPACPPRLGRVDMVTEAAAAVGEVEDDDDLLDHALVLLSGFLAASGRNGRQPPPAVRAAHLALAVHRERVRARQGATRLDAAADGLQPVVVTLDRAAELLAVSRRTVDRLVASGGLLAVDVGGCRRIAVEDIRAFVRASRNQEESTS